MFIFSFLPLFTNTEMGLSCSEIKQHLVWFFNTKRLFARSTCLLLVRSTQEYQNRSNTSASVGLRGEKDKQIKNPKHDVRCPNAQTAGLKVYCKILPREPPRQGSPALSLHTRGAGPAPELPGGESSAPPQARAPGEGPTRRRPRPGGRSSRAAEGGGSHTAGPSSGGSPRKGGRGRRPRGAALTVQPGLPVRSHPQEGL